MCKETHAQDGRELTMLERDRMLLEGISITAHNATVHSVEEQARAQLSMLDDHHDIEVSDAHGYGSTAKERRNTVLQTALKAHAKHGAGYTTELAGSVRWLPREILTMVRKSLAWKSGKSRGISPC